MRQSANAPRALVALCALAAMGFATPGLADPAAQIANLAIDVQGFLRVSLEAARHRKSHRLSEDEFIRMSREPGTLVLDARSREQFDELHIAGALNLSFPDIAIDSLARLLPDKSARILIYCNNNFTNADDAFPSKLPSASPNLSTYTALYDYGYRNVYELGPLIDVRASKIMFERARSRSR